MKRFSDFPTDEEIFQEQQERHKEAPEQVEDVDVAEKEDVAEVGEKLDEVSIDLQAERDRQEKRLRDSANQAKLQYELENRQKQKQIEAIQRLEAKLDMLQAQGMDMENYHRETLLPTIQELKEQTAPGMLSRLMSTGSKIIGAGALAGVMNRTGAWSGLMNMGKSMLNIGDDKRETFKSASKGGLKTAKWAGRAVGAASWFGRIPFRIAKTLAGKNSLEGTAFGAVDDLLHSAQHFGFGTAKRSKKKLKDIEKEEIDKYGKKLKQRGIFGHIGAGLKGMFKKDDVLHGGDKDDVMVKAAKTISSPFEGLKKASELYAKGEKVDPLSELKKEWEKVSNIWRGDKKKDGQTKPKGKEDTKDSDNINTTKTTVFSIKDKLNSLFDKVDKLYSEFVSSNKEQKEERKSDDVEDEADNKKERREKQKKERKEKQETYSKKAKKAETVRKERKKKKQAEKQEKENDDKREEIDKTTEDTNKRLKKFSKMASKWAGGGGEGILDDIAAMFAYDTITDSFSKKGRKRNKKKFRKAKKGSLRFAKNLSSKGGMLGRAGAAIITGGVGLGSALGGFAAKAGSWFTKGGAKGATSTAKTASKKAAAKGASKATTKAATKGGGLMSKAASFFKKGTGGFKGAGKLAKTALQSAKAFGKTVPYLGAALTALDAGQGMYDPESFGFKESLGGRLKAGAWNVGKGFVGLGEMITNYNPINYTAQKLGLIDKVDWTGKMEEYENKWKQEIQDEKASKTKTKETETYQGKTHPKLGKMTYEELEMRDDLDGMKRRLEQLRSRTLQRIRQDPELLRQYVGATEGLEKDVKAREAIIDAFTKKLLSRDRASGVDKYRITDNTKTTHSSDITPQTREYQAKEAKIQSLTDRANELEQQGKDEVIVKKLRTRAKVLTTKLDEDHTYKTWKNESGFSTRGKPKSVKDRDTVKYVKPQTNSTQVLQKANDFNTTLAKNTELKKGSAYQMGAKGTVKSSNKFDCSGWIVANNTDALNTLEVNGKKLTKKQKAKAIALFKGKGSKGKDDTEKGWGNARGIAKRMSASAGGYKKVGHAKEFKESDFEIGDIIAEDNKTGSYGRKVKLDHITQIVPNLEEGHEGEKMVSESSSGKGVHTTPLKQYLARKAKRDTELYVIDTKKAIASKLDVEQEELKTDIPKPTDTVNQALASIKTQTTSKNKGMVSKPKSGEGTNKVTSPTDVQAKGRNLFTSPSGENEVKGGDVISSKRQDFGGVSKASILKENMPAVASKTSSARKKQQQETRRAVSNIVKKESDSKQAGNGLLDFTLKDIIGKLDLILRAVTGKDSNNTQERKPFGRDGEKMWANNEVQKTDVVNPASSKFLTGVAEG